MSIMVRAMVLVTAMPVHECAHGLVADKLGDPTARNAGRLTLNPFAHLDLVGSLMILLAGFGWAKPVPVNPYNFRKNPRAGMALTAAAGPASNVVMAMITMLLAKLAFVSHLPFLLTQIFMIMCQINLSLAIFNLLPVFPLDGSRILSYFLPDRIVDKMEEHSQVIYFVFLGIVMLTDILDKPIGIASSFLLTGIDKLTSLFGLLPQVL